MDKWDSRLATYEHIQRHRSCNERAALCQPTRKLRCVQITYECDEDEPIIREEVQRVAIPLSEDETTHHSYGRENEPNDRGGNYDTVAVIRSRHSWLLEERC